MEYSVGKMTKKQRKAQRKALNRANPKIRNYYLYALELEDGNYYVGMTCYRNAEKRYEQHLAGTGAKWTKLHKPVSMIEVRDIGVCTESSAAQQEHDMAFEYINKYGINHVRGGKLCFVNQSSFNRHFNRNSPIKTTKVFETARDLRYQEKLARELVSWL